MRTRSVSPSTSRKSANAGAALPTVHCGWLNVRELGAVGDGKTCDTAAIQLAIERCGARGGGTVFVPPGRYLIGPLRLRSHVTLLLEGGAVLVASPDPRLYPIRPSQWEGPLVDPAHVPLIGGEGLSNIGLIGRGTIDGNGKPWWDAFNRSTDSHAPVRPNLVRFVDCNDVLIDGLSFINSPRWTLAPLACDNVTITRVTIRNPQDSPNTDGINPDSCRNVHIAHCHIDVGDDCIALKSGSEIMRRHKLTSVENVTISNCTMLHGHGGVVMGSEMSGGVRNVAISNCVFSGTDRGVRLKSCRGRGGAIEDIRVDNIVMHGVLCPIVLNQFYNCSPASDAVSDPSPRPVDSGTPRFRRLRFCNISARDVRYAAAFVLGLPEMPIEDVMLENCSIYLDRTCREAGSPAMAAGVDPVCRAGLIVKYARRVKLRRIDVHEQHGPAVSMEQCSDMAVDDLDARADGDSPLVEVDGAAVARESAAEIVQLHPAPKLRRNLQRRLRLAIDSSPTSLPRDAAEI